MRWRASGGVELLLEGDAIASERPLDVDSQGGTEGVKEHFGSDIIHGTTGGSGARARGGRFSDPPRREPLALHPALHVTHPAQHAACSLGRFAFIPEYDGDTELQYEISMQRYEMSMKQSRGTGAAL